MYDNNFTHPELMELMRIDSCLLRELCKRYLWVYCVVTEPDFYNDKHMYLKTICDALQSFYETDGDKYFVLSIPPQHGKSRTLKKFEEWVLINDKKIRFFSISYNEEYATDSSKNLLTAIRAEHEDGTIVLHDICPDLQIKRGEGAVNRWSVEGGYNTWLSASTNSGVTGRSANIVVVDDIIKDYQTAVNKKELKKIWTWFSNTLFSRRSDNNQKFIIVMTRWSKDDLAGQILKRFKNVKNVVMKAYDEETDTMLCDDIINKESYQEILRTVGEDVVAANYNQCPIDLKGQLYTHFNTYSTLENLKIKRINLVCDTADEGSDWLCAIAFAETYDKKAYILDILYTRNSVEQTIPATANFIKKNKIERAIFESNNGGKLFALSVKKELNERLKCFPVVKWFHQAKNKEARIITSSYDVQKRIYFPVGWQERFSEFCEDLMEYQREGKNEHDDAPDCLTMVLELLDNKLATK